MINLIFISDLLHSTENQNKFKTDFLVSSKERDMRVELKSDISDRIGHPVLNLKYWGDTYLCDNQWSHLEAKVMCRELGFESGAKFYKKQTSKKHKITYANYVGKFNCDGDEDKLTECDRTVLEVWMVLVKLVSVMKSVLRHYNANQMENVVAKLVTSQTGVKLARKIISEINPDNAKVCNFK